MDPTYNDGPLCGPFLTFSALPEFSAFTLLVIGYINCVGGTYYGSAIELSGVNLGSSGIKRFDVTDRAL